MLSLKTSVVVPALNEERNFSHVFHKFPVDPHEVTAVDALSVDNGGSREASSV